jgi:hypothetical protein
MNISRRRGPDGPHHPNLQRITRPRGAEEGAVSAALSERGRPMRGRTQDGANGGNRGKAICGEVATFGFNELNSRRMVQFSKRLSSNTVTPHPPKSTEGYRTQLQMPCRRRLGWKGDQRNELDRCDGAAKSAPGDDRSAKHIFTAY